VLSLGFILGNGVGAFLSTYSLHLPAFFASGVFVFNALLARTCLVETLPAPSEVSPAGTPSTFGLRPILDVLKTPQIGFFVAAFFVENFVFSLWRTTLSLFLKNSYALTPQQNGYVMMYFGFVSAITNFLLVGRLVARMPEEILALGCLVASAVSAGFLVFHSSLLVLVIGLTPAMMSTSIFNTCLSSILTKLGDRRLIGTTLGVLDSVDALGRTVAPTASGLLMDQFGSSAPGVFVALTSSALSVLYYLNMPRLQEPPKTKSE
jgi:DHA1 family multidrug resistance protein-like MFS transporter